MSTYHFIIDLLPKCVQIHSNLIEIHTNYSLPHNSIRSMERMVPSSLQDGYLTFWILWQNLSTLSKSPNNVDVTGCGNLINCQWRGRTVFLAFLSVGSKCVLYSYVITTIHLPTHVHVLLMYQSCSKECPSPVYRQSMSLRPMYKPQ